jgi:choline dehydrogenase-like flavoprotein
MAAKPLRIAVVGSGLSGAVLADRLAGHHDITLFERGPEWPARPEPPVMTAHRFGLYPSFAYGLGGTTSFWHGGLLALLDEEMGDAWPDTVKRELPRYYHRAVRQLYGADAERAWRARHETASADGIAPAQLFYPRTPFRAAASGLLTMAKLRPGHRVEQVIERAGGVDVVAAPAARPRPPISIG